MHGGYTDGERDLWVPGKDLDHAYPVPDQTELIEHCADTHGHTNVVEAPGLYGAVRVPDEKADVIASLDLCEVMRGTLVSMCGIFARTAEDLRLYSNYGPNFDIEDRDVVPIVQTLMNYDHIRPIEGAEEVGDKQESTVLRTHQHSQDARRQQLIF